MRERRRVVREQQAQEPARSGPDKPAPDDRHADVRRLQRAAGNAATVAALRGAGGQDASALVRRAIGSQSSPIAPEARLPVERRLGADLSDVRLHVDQSSTDALAARAFTTGDDVVVHPDHLHAGGTDVQRTIAHELTHVVQQRSGPVDGEAVARDLRVSDPDDRFERQAERTAEEVVSSPQASTDAVGGAVQRRASGGTEGVVQREGETSTTPRPSMRDRIKFFDQAQSSLAPVEKKSLPSGPTSFQDAFEMFKRLDGPKETSAPKEEPTPELVPVPETVETDDVLDNETKDETEVVDETTPEPTGPQPLGGGRFRGKRLDSHYKETEKLNYNPKTGFAQAEWQGSEGKSVKYLDQEQRKDYELKLDKGANLFFWRGEALDTTKMNRASTFEGRAGNGRVIFVMAMDGSIYLANEGQESRLGSQVNSGPQWRFNHSSFICGKKVAGAGELWFEGGNLKGISDNSGHYKPGLREILQVLRRFQAAGIDLSGVAMERRVGTEQTKDGLQVAKTETIDAQTMLELGSAEVVHEDLQNLEDLGKYNPRLKKILDYEDKDEELRVATELLNKAKENLRPGVDLVPAITKVMDLAKAHADTLDSMLQDDQPSRRACRRFSQELFNAFLAIDQIDDRWISAPCYDAADQLDDELVAMDDVDSDDRDFSSAQTRMATVDAELRSTPAPVDVSGRGAIGQEKQTKKERGRLETIGGHATDAGIMLDELLGGTPSLDTVTRYFTFARSVFAPAVRTAAVRKGISLDVVITKIADLATADESPRKGMQILEALRPGAGQRFLNDEIKGQLDKGSAKLAALFLDHENGSDIGDVAFGFAKMLVDDDGDPKRAAHIALDAMLKSRAEAGNDVADIDAFIDEILLPGAKHQKEIDVLEDALRIYRAANALRSGSASKGKLKKLMQEIDPD